MSEKELMRELINHFSNNPIQTGEQLSALLGEEESKDNLLRCLRLLRRHKFLMVVSGSLLSIKTMKDASFSATAEIYGATHNPDRLENFFRRNGL